MQNCTIRRITVEDFDSLPADRRPSALLGFVSQDEKAIDAEELGVYCDYARKNAARLAQPALKYPELLRFLCEYRLIPTKDFTLYLAEAEKQGDVESKALLLNYKKELGS